MADSAVSFVVGRLAEFAVKETKVLREVGSDVVLLKDKLQWLQTFVQQADHRRRRKGNAYMDVWVQQTREVALEVEDVLDDFMLRADLHQGLPMWKKWLKFLSSCATQISVRHNLSGRIAMVRTRLDQISEHSKAYITDYSSASTRVPPSVSTVDGWDDKLELVGINKNRASLEGLLMKGSMERLVVSIVGDSGIGKSALAWTVYDTPSVKRRFKARAWLNLPPCSTEADILYSLHKRFCHTAPPTTKGAATATEDAATTLTAKESAITIEDAATTTEDAATTTEKSAPTTQDVHGALLDHLKTKKYLIVVDGIVKAFNWSSVLDALPDNGKGSRVVIINSVNDNGAALAGLCPHMLRVDHLDEKDSSHLFRCNACGSGDQHRGSGKMYKVCKDMFEITNGLPLAILLLGRLLRRKEFPDQWDEVLQHLKSMERSSRLGGIVALSFDDLPHYLKSCFLHFAVMPENLIHNAGRLVRLWAAEGFLKARKGETMEDVGKKYLKELISRGMVRLVKTYGKDDIYLVTVHQQLHAMALLETQQDTLLDAYDKAHVLSSTSVRHLFLQNCKDAYIHHMKASFPKLRSISFAFFDDGESKPEEKQLKEQQSAAGRPCLPFPPRFKLPRVIKQRSKEQQLASGPSLPLPRRPKLSGVIKQQPKEKQSAASSPSLPLLLPRRSKLLRVIDLRGLQITKVPPEIGSFIHLRYLGIRSTELVELPQTIANLIYLQTLDIFGSKVKKVTRAFWKIPTLRHILAAHGQLEMPKSVGVLNNMQSLTGLVCVHPWHKISPLHKMINLRYLEIKELNSGHRDALSDAFNKLESLIYLNLSGCDIPFTVFTTMSLRRLQILVLHGKVNVDGVKKEPRCTLPNLTKLVLQSSELDKDFIIMIGKLSCLEELELMDGSYNGEEIDFSENGFANLTNLKLHDLTQVREMKIGAESLPKLERLSVVNCTNMRLKLEGEQVVKVLKEFTVIGMPRNWGRNRWRRAVR